jgi:hypothetical protein
MGSLAERLRAYKAVIAAPLEHMDLLPGFVDLAFAEARERTSNLVELPDGETKHSMHVQKEQGRRSFFLARVVNYFYLQTGNSTRSTRRETA